MVCNFMKHMQLDNKSKFKLHKSAAHRRMMENANEKWPKCFPTHMCVSCFEFSVYSLIFVMVCALSLTTPISECSWL